MPHRGVLVSIKADNEVGGELIQIENNWYVGFTASVDVEDADKLEDFGIAYVVLTYDAEVLQIDKDHSVKPGELLPHDATFISNTKVDGKITIVINTPGVKKDSNSKSIANITFKVIRQGFSNLTLSQVSLGDTTGKEIISTKAPPRRVDVDPDSIEIEAVEVKPDDVPQKEGKMIEVTVYEKSQIATEGFFNIGSKITGIPLECKDMTAGNNASENRIWTGQYTIEKCDDFVGPVTAILKNGIKSSKPKNSEIEITIDTMPPSPPGKPIHTDDNTTGDYDNDIQLDFSWSAAKDEVGIDQYNIDIFKDGSEDDTKETQDTHCIVTGEDGHTYRIRIKAVDKAGNVSEAVESNDIIVVIPLQCECIVSTTSGDNTAKIGDELSITVKITKGSIENIEAVTVNLTPIGGPADKLLDHEENVDSLNYQLKECEERRVDEEVTLTATVKDIVGNIKQCPCTAKVDLTPPKILSPVKVTIKNVDDDNQIADIGDEVEISLEASHDDVETVSVDLGDEIVLEAIGDEDDDSLHLNWDVKLKKYTGNFKVITGNVDTNKADSIDMKDLRISVEDNAGNMVETTAAISIDATEPWLSLAKAEVINDDNQIVNKGDEINIVVEASYGDGETVFVDLAAIGGGQEELPLDRIDQNVGYYQKTFKVQAGGVDDSNVEFPVWVIDNADNRSKDEDSNAISVDAISPFISDVKVIVNDNNDINEIADVGDKVIVTATVRASDGVNANDYDIDKISVDASVLRGEPKTSPDESEVGELTWNTNVKEENGARQYTAEIEVTAEGKTNEPSVFLTVTAIDDAGNCTQKQSTNPIYVYSMSCPIIMSYHNVQDAQKLLGIGYELTVTLEACEEAKDVSFNIGTLKEDVPMAEINPGKYSGSYTIIPGNEAEDALITVFMVDKGGRQCEKDVLPKITIDGIEPPVPSVPIHRDDDASEDYDNDTQLYFSWSIEDKSDIDHYNVYLSEDDGEYGNQPYDKVQNTHCIVTGEDEHTYKIKVKAVDKAGNVGEGVESDSVQVITPPEYTISITPDKTFKIGDTLSVRVEITKGRMEDIEGIDNPVTVDLTPIGGRQDEPLHYDDNAFNLSYPLDKEYTVDGEVSFEVTVRDITGNSVRRSDKANLDLTPPEISYVDVNVKNIDDNNGIADIGDEIEIIVKVSHDDGESVSVNLRNIGYKGKEESQNLGLDGDKYTGSFEVHSGGVDTNKADSPISLTDLPISIQDNAGNTRGYTVSIPVDAEAPAIHSVNAKLTHDGDNNQIANIGDEVEISVEASHDDGETVLVDLAAIGGGQEELPWNDLNSDYRDCFTVEGGGDDASATFPVWVIDNANNRSKNEDSNAISVDVVSPIIEASHNVQDARKPLGIGYEITVTLKACEDAKKVSFNIGTLIKDIAMAEISPGEYSGSYTVIPGNEAEDISITAFLVDKGDHQYEKEVLPKITVDGIKPPEPSVEHDDKTAKEGFDDDTKVDFCWDPVKDNLGVHHYNIDTYVCINETWCRIEQTKSINKDCLIEDKIRYTLEGEYESSYKIEVQTVDLAGNVGKTSKPIRITVRQSIPEVKIKIIESSPFIYSEKKEGQRIYLYYGKGMEKQQQNFEVWVDVKDDDGSEESECFGSLFIGNQPRDNSYSSRSPNFKLKYSGIADETNNKGELTVTVEDNQGLKDSATIEIIRDVMPPQLLDLSKKGRTEIRVVLKDDESGINPNLIKIKIKFNNETYHYSDNMKYDKDNGVLSFFCPERSQNGIYFLEIEVEDMVGNRNISSGSFGYGEPDLQVYNYPNPFEPGDCESQGTHFVCEIDRRAKISIKIFTVDGRFVKTLDIGECEPGIPKEERWDGKDRNGNEVNSDVFVCYVTADCNGKEIGKFHKILAWK
ncbi:Ig-like domain repeat protein [bacterium]|nr:Ig-like domain repeat protein [bacterium]